MNNPTVVGLDPTTEILPNGISTLDFNKGIIDAVYDIVPAVKPQIAFYEQQGIAGLQAYIETVAYARQKGMIVIGDIKRGDIASTAQAYADAHIGGGEFDVDFATINPYMGGDTMQPWINNCKTHDKGLFVLVKTSNKGSADFQNLAMGGKYLYTIVGENVEKWGAELTGKHGYSAIGAVVGATHPKELADMRKSLPHTFFLVPGYGAQGGTAADIAAAFDKNGIGAIINSSRGIITAYKQEKYAGLDFAQAARQAAIDMRDELNKARS
ncbi:MAG: orotidine-5'-phosphate decarboxylase [Defluviitaleaceae bacterium]|nr:orotidine-5'-phosphate decarboxylase [Defluviitaleaceae bacterium]